MLSPPSGFVPMAPDDMERLLDATEDRLRGQSTIVGKVAPNGPQEGTLAALRLTRPRLDQTLGHTLDSWVRTRTEARAHALGLDVPAIDTRERSVHTSQQVRLPSGGNAVTRSLYWLSADGYLEEAHCQCSGSGCTTPPACSLPTPAQGALPVSASFPADTPPLQLSVAGGVGTMDAQPHLRPLPKKALQGLTTARHTLETRHGVDARRADGGGAVLTDASWCVNEDGCVAKTVAEGRRKSHVAAVRDQRLLRSVRTLNDASAGMHGYEIEQHDGMWTRAWFWNEGHVVRQISCACTGTTCALAKATCSVTPK